MNKFTDDLTLFAEEIDVFLKNILEKKITLEGVLKEAIHYSSIGSGKRIRGFLTSETAKFFKAKKNHALNVACAIELVHSYSLIHDDLPALDNDALRRNKPSNHIKFSEATAILAGDALQAMAFEILSDSIEDFDSKKQVMLINEFSKKIGSDGMVGGQMIDINSKKSNLSILEINKMHELKTANLISFSCMAGAIIGNAKDEEIKAFEDYGKNFGIAFQIIDDVLDIVGDKAQIGKTLGKDEINNNKTYLSHFDVEESLKVAEEYCNKAISSINMFEKIPENFINALDFIRFRKF